MNWAFSGDGKAFEMLQQLMKVHGAYTEGFFENERKRFERLLTNGKSI